jgi:(p)ppGpp synthase/HD superfamily hydrolase
MSTLNKAIQIASQAHSGQKDKYGRPFILHPLRMLTQMETEPEMIVAALHDVVEKSEKTLADLKKAGFSPDILEAVECLTKRENEPYLEYIRRSRVNPLAKRVKEADLQDHLDSLKKYSLTELSPNRLTQYAEAMEELGKDKSESQ